MQETMGLLAAATSASTVLTEVALTSQPKREPTSVMVQMAYDSDKILAEAGVEIPLFW